MSAEQTRTRRRYTTEEKARGVALAGRNGVCAAARELGIPQTSLSNWLAAAAGATAGYLVVVQQAALLAQVAGRDAGGEDLAHPIGPGAHREAGHGAVAPGPGASRPGRDG